jgi:hypothetical protein
MKGLSILFDERRKKRIVQIDLDTVSKDPEAVEDLLDVLVAEARRDEPTISLDAYLATRKRANKTRKK